jgi:DNA-3-methyladenine glycosylase
MPPWLAPCKSRLKTQAQQQHMSSKPIGITNSQQARVTPSFITALTRSQPPLRTLRRRELPTDTIELARYLIGQTLVRRVPSGILSGRIVETEAYPVGDAAGHAFRGITPRNRSLFLARGHAYVYVAYGSAVMFNVTSEPVGIGAGVLLRALEPLAGLEWMQRFRGTKSPLQLARGPGRLSQAMAISLADDGIDLCAHGPLWLAAAIDKPGVIRQSGRIGLSRNAALICRFYEAENPYVSGPRNLR